METKIYTTNDLLKMYLRKTFKVETNIFLNIGRGFNSLAFTYKGLKVTSYRIKSLHLNNFNLKFYPIHYWQTVENIINGTLKEYDPGAYKISLDDFKEVKEYLDRCYIIADIIKKPVKKIEKEVNTYTDFIRNKIIKAESLFSQSLIIREKPYIELLDNTFNYKEKQIILKYIKQNIKLSKKIKLLESMKVIR